jgi:hypothetical protein
MNLELCYRYHVLATLRERHFDKAALRLQMMQPPLSRTVTAPVPWHGARTYATIGIEFDASRRKMPGAATPRRASKSGWPGAGTIDRRSWPAFWNY